MHHAILDVCILDVDDPTLPLDDRSLVKFLIYLYYRQVKTFFIL